MEGDATLYQSKQTQKVILESSMYPIYAQILEMEAWELYNIEKIIKNLGGIPLDRNTDAVRYQMHISNQINLDEYFWDNEKNQNL